jgi:hypothetical protein
VIVYPSSYVLSAAVPLRNPRIGHQTWTNGLAPSAVSVSTETASGPKDAPLRPDTGEYWQPSALPATWVLDLGTTRNVDYVGIAAHTIGSLGLSVGVALGATTDFDARVTLPGVAGNYATTPDTVANSITGDIDIRCKALLTDWTPAGSNIFLAKRSGAIASQTSYLLWCDAAGNLNFTWSDGATVFTKTSTVATGVADGAMKWVRAVLDVDNGAAGNDVKFYTSPDGVTYTQLGATVTTAGTTSIRNGTEVVEIGSQFTGTSLPLSGTVYYAEIRNGIAGAVVATFDPSYGITDGTSFTSPTGEVWTINVSGGTPARLINPRFGGTADILPANDAPIMFLDTQTSARYLRIRIAGVSATMPKMAVAYAGVALAMSEELEGRGFMPSTLSRQTVLKKSMSRGGNFLGQGVRRNGVTTNPSFKLLESSWYRANFDPFVKNARRYPYFLAWCPQDFPQDVGFLWTEKDIVGKYTGGGPWMEVAWTGQGIGND